MKIKIIELSENDAYYDEKDLFENQEFELTKVMNVWKDGWFSMYVEVPNRLKSNEEFSCLDKIILSQCKFEYV